MSKRNISLIDDGFSEDSYEDLEDGIIKDSVLKLTSNKFDDIAPDEFVGAKLRNRNLVSQEDIENEYKGITVARKSLTKNDFVESDNESASEGGIEDDAESEEGSDYSEGSEDDGDEDASDREDVSDIDDDDDNEERNDSDKKKGDVLNADSANYELYSKNIHNVKEDVEKGNAIRNQIAIWESLLECRIKLHKALAASNCLPQGSNFAALKADWAENDCKKIAKACKNVSSVLQLLIGLQNEMVTSYPEFADKAVKLVTEGDVNDEDENMEDDNESISSSIASGFSDKHANSSDGNASDHEAVEPPNKRFKLDNLEKCLNDAHTQFIPARNKAIQKWNDKTRLSSGRVKSSNFSAFDQSTLKQIEQILSDKSRLISRTQIRRSVYTVLGKEDNSDPDIGEKVDAEIFDDDDFYHKLLREFIEKKSNDVSNPQQMGRQWAELQKIRSKMKRPIDVKATKGRRLKYTTHTKLVSFMAPMPYNSWTNEAESELYSSLFGEIKQKQ